MSGGDRIWIEFAKRARKKVSVTVYLWEEGAAIAKREGLKHVRFVVWPAKSWARFGFFINYFARIFIAVFHAFFMHIDDDPSTVVYSASEFWQDSLPAVILKFRFPKIRWVAAWYQTAPNPFEGFTEGKRVNKYRFKAFLYWLAQLPVKPIISAFADLVVVNNENERCGFPELDRSGKVFVILGGVDLTKINRFRSGRSAFRKVYDGVFQGRFHPQKGVVELVDIWGMVVSRKPDAKLAVIGDGPLMRDVELKVRELNLRKNVVLFGYVFDGPKKYKIFAQSRVVLHPAFYDSGGMAVAEAMAFGLPAVGFDLLSYSSYYPRGMAKVPAGDLAAFSKRVLELLGNRLLYRKMSSQAIEFVRNKCSWDVRLGKLIDALYLIR